MIGTTMGMVATISDKVSMKKPSTRYSAMTSSSVPKGDSPDPPIRSVSCRPSPAEVMAKFRNVAPVTTSMIIAEMRMVPCSASDRARGPRPSPSRIAISAAMATPMAALSVGVAQPA